MLFLRRLIDYLSREASEWTCWICNCLWSIVVRATQKTRKNWKFYPSRLSIFMSIGVEMWRKMEIQLNCQREREKREWGATWWRGESFLCEKLSSNDYQSISAPYLSTCHRFLMLEESFTRLFIGVGESEMKIVKMSVYTTLSIVQWVATLLWIWSHVLEYQVIFLRFVNWLVICEQRRRVVGEVSERWFNVPKEIKEFSSVSTLSQHWSTSFVNVFVYDKNY